MGMNIEPGDNVVSLAGRQPLLSIKSIDDLARARTGAEEVHRTSFKHVASYLPVRKMIKKALRRGPIRITRSGIEGKGYNALDTHTGDFLDAWVAEYLADYAEYEQQLGKHPELRNYREVMQGAVRGVVAGTVAGTAIDGYATLTNQYGIGWELAARSLPALLEAEEIARPFFRRLGEWYRYALGKSTEKPEQITTTETWALTQLLGPVIGAGMLVAGEMTGWNDDPAYKAAAVVTLNTGNNVIGALSAYVQYFMESQGRFISRLYQAAGTFWADRFQSSNALVAGLWYGIEQVLRNNGIAAEHANLGNGFGGKTLAALESGMLSMDTAVAARLAIAREEKKREKEIRKLTSPEYLHELYEKTRPPVSTA